MILDEKNRYYSLDSFYKEKFGEKIYKISLDGGFTCPNRDGSKGLGGCVFCNGGSGYFAEKEALNISIQLEKAKERIINKSKSNHFIAYFQSYSNTYGKIEYLKSLYESVIFREDIVGLALGTRPDCINDDVLSLLIKLNKRKPVFVELGLQSTNKRTIDIINRCYDNEVYFDITKKIRQNCINVVTHLIFGFPWESREDMLESVEMIRDETDGIKMHMLNVLEGTKLAEMYKKENYKLLTLEEYTSILCKALQIIPNTVVIHRFTGDPPKKILIEPKWTMDKKRVLNYIKSQFDLNNIIQGSHYN